MAVRTFCPQIIAMTKLPFPPMPGELDMFTVVPAVVSGVLKPRVKARQPTTSEYLDVHSADTGPLIYDGMYWYPGILVPCHYHGAGCSVNSVALRHTGRQNLGKQRQIPFAAKLAVKAMVHAPLVRLQITRHISLQSR
jgi:hypothetical protein